MRKPRFLSSKLAKPSIKASAAATPVVSSADTPFSDNSRASVAAVAELSECLDFMFDQATYQDEPGDLLQLHLGRVAEEASKYSNASIERCDVEEWICAPEVANLVRATCYCSNMVYGPIQQRDLDMVREFNGASSLSGTNKAFSIWKMDSLNAIIVSVRGTASMADHMVNLNSEIGDASSVMNIPSGISAHRGFLTCAKSLLSVIRSELEKLVASDASFTQVLFTGHSAGGAVSSLLFLNLAFNPLPRAPHITTSLITFGSAPALSENMSDLIRKIPNIGTVLAIVNEYDMVPRADKTYIQSLIDLYRSKYGLSRAGTDPGEVHGSGLPSPIMPGSVDRSTWPLPKPMYYLLGDIVISKSFPHTSPISTADSASDLTARPSLSYRMFRVSQDQFSSYLFCGLGVHKRRIYLERIRSSLGAEPYSWSDSATLRTVGSQHTSLSSGTAQTA